MSETVRHGGSGTEDETLRSGPVERPTVDPGTRIGGRYLVQREVGEGGMGVVYAVRDEQLDETVALKLLLPPVAWSADTLTRFKREVRLARRVTHRNVARTYDIGDGNGFHWLTMELVEGQSLRNLLQRQGPLSPERAADVTRQICLGLAAAHDAGVVHRDLKPANIIMEVSGRVVITDFGVAHSTLDSSVNDVDRDLLVGTPAYMAPEQLQFGAITARTDLYPVGMILFEMLTGRPLVAGSTDRELLLARPEGVPLPQTLAPLPPALREVVEACLQADPRERPEAADVARLCTPADAPAHEDTVLHRPQPPFIGSVPCLWALGVLPFTYEGPPESRYMAQVMTGEVVDLLSMTSGIRVHSAAATAHLACEPDHHAAAKDLGVDALVIANVQAARSGELHLATHLCSTGDGAVRWSGEFEGRLSDVFRLQASLATRVAETLRVQLQTNAVPEEIPAKAVEAYLQARDRMRAFDLGGEGPDGAPALFERCLELAPGFPPAHAGYALACARMLFFFADKDGEQRDWPTICEHAVELALERAPRVPETHIAAARMHMQHARYAQAARSLRHALQLAPTCASARGLLGSLQCEAGRGEEGIRHIDLANELDPDQRWTLLTKARHLAFTGRRDEADALLRGVREHAPDLRGSAIAVGLRIAVWYRDLPYLERTLAETKPSDPVFRRMIAETGLGLRTPAEVDAVFGSELGAAASRRLSGLAHQAAAESLLCSRQVDAAFHHLDHAVDDSLVDLEWLDNCPLWDGLREDQRFAAARARVQARTSAIWTL